MDNTAAFYVVSWYPVTFMNATLQNKDILYLTALAQNSYCKKSNRTVISV
jgi:hypothetical protein